MTAAASSGAVQPPPGSALILGVDPGSHHTGYGLVLAAGPSLKLVTQGRFSPAAAWPLPRRLAHIHRGLTELIEGHRPQAVAVEDIFHSHNVNSALKLGHVRGVVLLTAALCGATVFEYAPRLVKNAVAGYGQAGKAQVAHMVAELLNFHEPLAADAADALAVAICHAGQSRLSGLLPAAAGRGRGGWRGLSPEDLEALNYKR